MNLEYEQYVKHVYSAANDSPDTSAIYKLTNSQNKCSDSVLVLQCLIGNGSSLLITSSIIVHSQAGQVFIKAQKLKLFRVNQIQIR